MGRILAFIAFIAGIVLRYQYISAAYAGFDPGRLVSDSEVYWKMSETEFDPSYRPTIYDTLFPPGYGWFIGLLRYFDRHGGAVFLGQFCMSLLLPVFLYIIAKWTYGERRALAVFCVACVYFPLWEYFGMIMSEGPFMFFLLAWFAALIASLRAKTRPVISALALFSGILLAVSATMKSVSLITAVFVFFAILLFGRERARFRVRVLAYSILGVIIVLSPVAVRASLLNNGRFLLIANEVPRGFLLGHYGQIQGVYFADANLRQWRYFGSPSAYQHGNRVKPTLNAAAYDQDALFAIAFDWIKAHPLETVKLSFDHVVDLCWGSYAWPGLYGPYALWGKVSQWLFLALLLPPAVAAIVQSRGKLLRRHPDYLFESLFLFAALSIVVSVFIVIGEPRYRIPYDGFVILLAAGLRLRRDPPPGAKKPEGN